jgi:hypothetical protein
LNTEGTEKHRGVERRGEKEFTLKKAAWGEAVRQ